MIPRASAIAFCDWPERKAKHESSIPARQARERLRQRGVALDYQRSRIIAVAITLAADASIAAPVVGIAWLFGLGLKWPILACICVVVVWRLFYLCPGPYGYDISFRGRRYRRAAYDVSRDEHGIWTAINRLTGRESYGITREAAIGKLAQLEYKLWQAEGRKRLGVRGLLSRWGRR